MSKLSKLVKKARKKLKLPPLTLGTAAKVGAAVATGGLPALGTAVVLSKLKNAAVGGVKQAIKSKAAKVLSKRTAILTPPITASPAKPKATHRPGGAAMKAAVAALGPRAAAARPRVKKARAKASGGGRKPPKGGKDLKALSASWKAAGKPGKWIDWVKTH